MISYQIAEHGKPLQKVTLETPKPQGTEVLVRVTRTSTSLPFGSGVSERTRCSGFPCSVIW